VTTSNEDDHADGDTMVHAHARTAGCSREMVVAREIRRRDAECTDGRSINDVSRVVCLRMRARADLVEECLTRSDQKWREKSNRRKVVTRATSEPRSTMETSATRLGLIKQVGKTLTNECHQFGWNRLKTE
jgi:hypothetical protein